MSAHISNIILLNYILNLYQHLFHFSACRYISLCFFCLCVYLFILFSCYLIFFTPWRFIGPLLLALFIYLFNSLLANILFYCLMIYQPLFIYLTHCWLIFNFTTIYICLYLFIDWLIDFTHWKYVSLYYIYLFISLTEDISTIYLFILFSSLKLYRLILVFLSHWRPNYILLINLSTRIYNCLYLFVSSFNSLKIYQPLIINLSHSLKISTFIIFFI